MAKESDYDKHTSLSLKSTLKIYMLNMNMIMTMRPGACIIKLFWDVNITLEL